MTGCGEITCILPVVLKHSAAILANSLVIPQKLKQRISIWPSNSTQEKWKCTFVHTSMYTDVHSTLFIIVQTCGMIDNQGIYQLMSG
jgi:hypothetical protein